jgi:16S rRNA (cytosine1402-N4)-methyltransferase
MVVAKKEDGNVEGCFTHRPVLLQETVQYLAVRPGGVYIDCTIGEGGHALAILQAATPGGRVLGIDQDSNSLELARWRLQRHQSSLTLVQGNYSRVRELADNLGYSLPDGILMDLGLSSLQLESPGRGFSFQREDPLDMRYDPEGPVTAGDMVNRYSFDELNRIIFSYGEEPKARSVARAIIERRPIETTLELAELVARVYGGRRKGRTHPATRTFQALRIAVNGELDNLVAGLGQAISLLKSGGVLVVISYHSLEDRIVKNTLVREARGCICPPRIPICTCGHTPSVKLLSRKIVTPSPEEVAENPRSRSARMRVAQSIT